MTSIVMKPQNCPAISSFTIVWNIAILRQACDIENRDGINPNDCTGSGVFVIWWYGIYMDMMVIHPHTLWHCIEF